MRYVIAGLIFGGLIAAGAGHAQETKATVTPASDVSTSTTTIDESGSHAPAALRAFEPKRFKEDSRINDLELRAQNGSMSRYSLKFNLGYSGSPINNLADPDRPNPDHRAGDYRTNLSGSAGLRYRIDRESGINLSTGVEWYTPVQAISNKSVRRPKGANNFDSSDPGLSYDRQYMIGQVQSRSSLFVSMVTDDYYKGLGQTMGVGPGQYFKWVVYQSRLILGAQISGSYYSYDRTYNKLTDGKAQRYTLNFIPSVEYKILDNLNFNTSLGYSYANLRMVSNYGTWLHQLTTWRVGVGWAITHDVYVNPYINFFAEQPAFNTASLNLSTIFSIF